jgi:hypothetical protein
MRKHDGKGRAFGNQKPKMRACNDVEVGYFRNSVFGLEREIALGELAGRAELILFYGDSERHSKRDGH